MYKNKNKNTRDKATQPTQATNAVSSPPCTNYEELDELQLERCYAGQEKNMGNMNELGNIMQEINTLQGTINQLTFPAPEDCEAKKQREEALTEAYQQQQEAYQRLFNASFLFWSGGSSSGASTVPSITTPPGITTG